MTVADTITSIAVDTANSKTALATIQSDLDALKAAVAALPTVALPVATDPTLQNAIAAVQSTADAIKAELTVSTIS